MDQPSIQIADRYGVSLAAEWQRWFDRDARTLRPAGVFQTALYAESLAVPCPAEIWPGFMLPDTLPIIGNEYGDWLCVRILADGTFGELLHWYHGGGDWVPLGNRLAEALLHDVVDQFRPVVRQMLRGASETIEADHLARVLADFQQTEFQHWLSNDLTSPTVSQTQVSEILTGLQRMLVAGDYLKALQLLYDRRWSQDAVACDLIEEALQRPIVRLADPAIAKSLELNWTPDYVRWLFDIDRVPLDTRAQIMQLAGLKANDWPQQFWSRANELAMQTLDRRHDLGWAFDVVGWYKQRSGDEAGAAQAYFAGRYASAFSDQAVRMRTHWVDGRFGKFAIAQLGAFRHRLPPEQQQDAYLQTIWQAPEKLKLTLVQEFWMSEGRRQLECSAYPEAYDCFYRAGWDMGVQRLSEYQRVLELLVECAQAAGWTARAAVAKTHLDCLLQRFG